MFRGATVERGPDWIWNDQDGRHRCINWHTFEGGRGGNLVTFDCRLCARLGLCNEKHEDWVMIFSWFLRSGVHP